MIDGILVPRDLLAATSYMLRRGNYAESKTAAKIYALAISETAEGKMKPHGLRDLSDKLMEVARQHSYFNQAADVLHNMESHLCSMAALYEQQQYAYATERIEPIGIYTTNFTKGQETPMHASTYDYLKPTDQQMETMAAARDAAKSYGEALDVLLPDGPDKTFIIRMHRQTAMWANVAITRHQDGSPRDHAPE